MWTLSKIFRRKKEKPKRYECTIIGCHNATREPRSPNPRLRWMIEVILRDHDTEEDIPVNLCPKHIKEFFALKESDFLHLENSEKAVQESRGMVH